MAPNTHLRNFVLVKARRFTAALFCAGWLLPLLGCQSAQPMSDPVIYETHDWNYGKSKGLRLVSPHYELHTTCIKRKPFVEAMPGFMEACYEAYRKLLPTTTEPAEPMKSYLFLRRAEWEHFTNAFAGPRASTYKQIRRGGYSERGVTVSFYTTQASTLAILAHEGLHQYLDITGRSQIPAWINEGLACYFEAFELDIYNHPTFKPENNALRSPAMREALTNETLIPLKEILGTHAGIAIHKQSSHVRSYYAQEWSLVLFLLDSPATNKYAPGFKTLLDELGTEAMNRKANAYIAADSEGSLSRGEAIFRAYITEDLEAFDADYRKFLHELLDLKQF
ncbi:MAG: DUF1570 domain-containing protein [Planctomycetes bacterium]|nr:DUF1570 domain-containing protein [Planctomycetota bacterium]